MATPEQLAARRKFAENLLALSQQSGPTNILGALNRALQGAIGGSSLRGVERDETAQREALARAISGSLGSVFPDQPSNDVGGDFGATTQDPRRALFETLARLDPKSVLGTIGPKLLETPHEELLRRKVAEERAVGGVRSENALEALRAQAGEGFVMKPAEKLAAEAAERERLARVQQGLSDAAPTGRQKDVRLLAQLQGKVESGTATPDEERQLAALQSALPSTEAGAGQFADSSRARAAAAALGVPPELVTAPPTDNPAVRKLQADVSGTRRFMVAKRRLGELVKAEGGNVISALGRASTVISSIKSQAEQFAKNLGVVDETSRSAAERSAASRIPQWGTMAATAKSELLDLAYAKARTNEGAGGRLTNQDLDLALQQLGASLGDPEAFLQVIHDAGARMTLVVEEGARQVGVPPDAINWQSFGVRPEDRTPTQFAPTSGSPGVRSALEAGIPQSEIDKARQAGADAIRDKNGTLHVIR